MFLSDLSVQSIVDTFVFYIDYFVLSSSSVRFSHLNEENADSADDVTEKRREKNVLSEENESVDAVVNGVMGKVVEQDYREAVADQTFAVRDDACCRDECD